VQNLRHGLRSFCNTVPNAPQDVYIAQLIFHVCTMSQASPPIILVVDDEPEIRNILTEILSEHGFVVVSAASASRALELATASTVDLVIADLHMPHMNGFEFISRLREHVMTRAVPVIVLTADATDEALFTGFERGAVDFMTKPFKTRELVLRINAKLRMREEARTDPKAQLEAPKHVSSDAQFIERLHNTLLGMYSLTEYIDLNPREIASRMSMTVPTLHRTMRRIMNMSLGNWLLVHRLDHARGMIEARVGTLTQIAYATGFKSPSYFSVAFRNQFGTTPSAYRESVLARQHQIAEDASAA
jgi:DNA-binding response OmpR family regulator